MRKIVALFLLAGTAWAAPQPQVAAPVPAAERLIAQLADKNQRVREMAHQALEAMGSEALPALRKAQSHRDPEVRRRVGQLLAVKQFDAILKPKRLALHIRDRTVKEAVTELAKQSGYKLEINGAANADADKQRVCLDLEHATFWEAFDRLCTAAGLVYNDNIDDNGRVFLQLEQSFQPFVYRDGLFRAVAGGFNQNRGISFATLPKTGPPGGQASDNLHFYFTISGEPRLPLLGLGSVVVTEAVDDLNNSLVPREEVRERFARHYWYGNYKSHVQRTGCNLSLVAREARRVKRVKGFVPVTLLLEEKPDLVVDDIRSAKGKKLKSAKAELDIEEVAEVKNQGSYRIKLAIRNKAGNVDYGWYNSVTQRLVLLDAKGNKYDHNGASWSGSQNSVTADFRFSTSVNGAGPPAKLIYYDWVTLQYRTKFEFRDLPLP